MFKTLYNNLMSLNLNFKSNVTINLFSFLKKSSLIKNYSNYLNFYITIFNQMKLKTIQTSFWVFSPDVLVPYLNKVIIVWAVIEIITM